MTLELVADTSVIIALLSSEKERNTIIDSTDGREFVFPEIGIPEIGNAFSAMFKRGCFTLEQGKKLVKELKSLKIRLMPLNLERSAEICHQHGIYA